MSIWTPSAGVVAASEAPASGPPPFSPSDIAGLHLWLDAADAATLWADTAGTDPADVAEAVARWDDKSANGYTFIQATSGQRPVRQSGYVEFASASDQHLQQSGAFSTVAQPGTVFAVYRCTNTGANRAICNLGGLSLTQRTGDVQANLGSNARWLDLDIDTADHILRIEFGGSTSDDNCYRDGVASSSNPLNAGSGSIITGASGGTISTTGATGMTGRIYALLVYNSILDSEDITAVEDWLSTRYSI